MIKKRAFTIVFLAIAFLFFLYSFDILLPQSDSQLKKKDFVTKEIKTFNYVALGDSLTEGIGDKSGQGGFVSLLANELQNSYHFQVEAVNYGVAGNTSNQILKRLEATKEIQADISTADLLTITVGGNDVMAVIRKKMTDLTVKDFEEASLKYQKRLKKIIQLSQELNEDLPIYIIGIYNPFYLSFPDITEMQEITDNWNLKTKEITELYSNVYFVPINDIIYQGLEDELVTTQGGNNVLFEEDNFHPNAVGYRLMANAVKEIIDDTQQHWQKDNN